MDKPGVGHGKKMMPQSFIGCGHFDNEQRIMRDVMPENIYRLPVLHLQPLRVAPEKVRFKKVVLLFYGMVSHHFEARGRRQHLKHHHMPHERFCREQADKIFSCVAAKNNFLHRLLCGAGCCDGGFQLGLHQLAHCRCICLVTAHLINDGELIHVRVDGKTEKRFFTLYFSIRDCNIFEVPKKTVMNLFVKNIDGSINAFHLEMLFKTYGEIKSAKVLYDHASGEHKGCGFVEMNNDADAEKAIEALNGKEIKGKLLSVEKAKPKKVNIWG